MDEVHLFILTRDFSIWCLSLSLPNSASLGEFKTKGCGLSCDRLERKFMRSQNRSRRTVYPYSYVASYCLYFFFCLLSFYLSSSLHFSLSMLYFALFSFQIYSSPSISFFYGIFLHFYWSWSMSAVYVIIDLQVICEYFRITYYYYYSSNNKNATEVGE